MTGSARESSEARTIATSIAKLAQHRVFIRSDTSPPTGELTLQTNAAAGGGTFNAMAGAA